MRINEILCEAGTVGATTSAAIAAVCQPILRNDNDVPPKRRNTKEKVIAIDLGSGVSNK